MNFDYTSKYFLHLFIVLIFFQNNQTYAASNICDWYRKTFPTVYNNICGGGKQEAKPAGANSTFAAAFNTNPAALPTENTPYGIETIGSYIRNGQGKWKPQFSLIKGFKKFGTGVSTASNNTFFGNDVVRRIKSHPDISSFKVEDQLGKAPDLNFGTSIAINPESKGRLNALRLGLTLRHIKATDSTGGGVGLTMGNEFLTMGAGLTRENVSNLLPVMYFSTFNISSRIYLLELELTVLKNYDGVYLPPIKIGTATLNVGKLLLSAAGRKNYYVNDGEHLQYHYSLQYNFTKKITLGYMFNYIPGTNSLAMQIFL